MTPHNEASTVYDLKKHLDELFNREVAKGEPSEFLTELLCDPVGYDSEHPLFNFGNHSTATSGGDLRGVPDGADELAPPLTNRRVSKYHKSIMGGFDGGLEIGFNGRWHDRKFATIVADLESARTAAETKIPEERFAKIGNYTFLVNPHGGGSGVHYRFILEGLGLKVYIHHNPKGDIQGVRIRYGFESLAGRSAYAVHALMREWLSEIGFHVEKETLSRVDMQVMFERDIMELISPIFKNQLVCRIRKSSVNFNGNRVESYTAGGDLQVCIYDKKAELLASRDEVKLNIMINEYFREGLPEHLTRVEFRLRRKALKSFGINTMEDLLKHEHALAKYLTREWFRILAGPKVRGSEKEQKVLPLWRGVQRLFEASFPGVSGRNEPVDRLKNRELKCTGKELIRQAVGCLSTAAALAKGFFETESEALIYGYRLFEEQVKRFFQRTCERAREIGVVRGIIAPPCPDWHVDPRFACDDVKNTLLGDLMGMIAEERDYLRFRDYAVEGCPF